LLMRIRTIAVTAALVRALPGQVRHRSPFAGCG
jgi:hypothetical protein